jgi:hypothetical protein
MPKLYCLILGDAAKIWLKTKGMRMVVSEGPEKDDVIYEQPLT